MGVVNPDWEEDCTKARVSVSIGASVLAIDVYFSDNYMFCQFAFAGKLVNIMQQSKNYLIRYCVILYV